MSDDNEVPYRGHWPLPSIYADPETGLIKVLKRKLADIGPSDCITVYKFDAMAIVEILEAYAALKIDKT